MLDTPARVCPAQAGFEYPATSVPLVCPGRHPSQGGCKVIRPFSSTPGQPAIRLADEVRAEGVASTQLTRGGV
jgi:hypothetical protein